MPATLPEVRLAEAVSLVRRNRHHLTCNCFLFRKDGKGEGYCSADEALWNRTVDRLIDDVLRAKR